MVVHKLLGRVAHLSSSSSTRALSATLRFSSASQMTHVHRTPSQQTAAVEFDFTVVKIDGQSVKPQRNVVILMFDICERKLIKDVNMWLNDVRLLCGPNVAVILVGNQADLATNRVVTLAVLNSVL